MYYLINKQTNEVIDASEKKSQLRKRAKAEPEKYKVSKVKPGGIDAPKKKVEKEDKQSTIDEAIAGNPGAKKTSEFSNHKRFDTEDEAVEFVNDNDLVEYDILRHADDSFLVFYEDLDEELKPNF